MTKVSFYKINIDSIPLGLVCELVQKAHCSSHQVLCQVPSQQVADSLDSLLWTHDPASFIPHGVGSKNIPVAISTDPFPGDHYQLLINLCHEIPEWFSRFERIIEIVNSSRLVGEKCIFVQKITLDNFRPRILLVSNRLQRTSST